MRFTAPRVGLEDCPPRMGTGEGWHRLKCRRARGLREWGCMPGGQTEAVKLTDSSNPINCRTPKTSCPQNVWLLSSCSHHHHSHSSALLRARHCGAAGGRQKQQRAKPVFTLYRYLSLPTMPGQKGHHITIHKSFIRWTRFGDAPSSSSSSPHQVSGEMNSIIGSGPFTISPGPSGAVLRVRGGGGGGLE